MTVSDVLSSSCFSSHEGNDTVPSGMFLLGAYLTDPVCKVREYFWRARVVDALNPRSSAIVNLARKTALIAAMSLFAFVALFATGPGAVLRGLAAHWQNRPFLYAKGDGATKSLSADRSFSLLSWNICCVAGGYSITDGGVVPWEERIDQIIEAISRQGADVNCLYETFDAKSGFRLSEELKKRGYVHCYYNIGPQAVGVSSGILVASKYEIANPEFQLFPQDSLVGRTKNAAKGVFGFDLVSEGRRFATVFTTHLQHSEEPQFPTYEEIQGRRLQMMIIKDKVDKIRDRCVVVTGDLNLDDAEREASEWSRSFAKGEPYEGFSWDGDAFCAALSGKRASGPLNLDHTMAVRGSIETKLVETGYDPQAFKKDALSDHKGLLSRIFV